MKKRIKKKFANSNILTSEVFDVIKSASSTEADFAKVVNDESFIPFVVTEGKEMVQLFRYKDKYLVQPSPIVMYFDIAKFSIYQLHSSRDQLLASVQIDFSNRDVYRELNLFYKFYGQASIAIFSMFNAIEAFINSMIPTGYKYRDGNKTFDKNQIQRKLPFAVKIKIVMPSIYEKTFHTEYPEEFALIWKLKEFRDEIMHTKCYDSKGNIYSALFVASLDFDYDSTINTIQNYINYYKPNLIESIDLND